MLAGAFTGEGIGVAGTGVDECVNVVGQALERFQGRGTVFVRGVETQYFASLPRVP